MEPSGPHEAAWCGRHTRGTGLDTLQGMALRVDIWGAERADVGEHILGAVREGMQLDTDTADRDFLPGVQEQGLCQVRQLRVLSSLSLGLWKSPPPSPHGRHCVIVAARSGHRSPDSKSKIDRFSQWAVIPILH